MKIEYKYALFGFLWGIPIPIVTVMIELMATETIPTISNLARVFTTHPLHFFFLAHPVIFAAIFSFLGRQRDRSEHLTKLLIRRLEHASQSDLMTGLLNHATFQEKLEVERGRQLRRKARPTPGKTLCVLMIDIDFFKKVNDEWGHIAGDDVLIQTAGLIRSQVRAYDHVGRYGGEEFAVILPDISIDEARIIAERIRCSVEAHHFPGGIRITVSVGLAELRECREAGALMHAVDAALYQAKSAGRNKVVCAVE